MATTYTESESVATAPEYVTEFVTDDPAFGIWRDYVEAENVAALARRLRTPRYNHDGASYNKSLPT